jgi:hypothetical protein
MWCGEKLEENYQNSCKAWTNLVDRARAENMQHVTDMGEYLADELDYLSFSASNVSSSTTDVQQQPGFFDTKAMDEAFGRVKQALDDAQTLTRSRNDTRQMLLARQLQAEIAAGRGILPSQEIVRAEAAFQLSDAEKQQALVRLQAAWGSISEAGSLKKRHEYQAHQIIRSVRTQLAAIDAMLQNNKNPSRVTLTGQQRAIEDQVREAETLLNINAASALGAAQRAEQRIRGLIETISSEMISTWSNRRKEINTLKGMLQSLAAMLQEAQAVQLLSAGQIAKLTERINKAQAGLGILEKDGSSSAPQQLNRLKARIDLLKEDVFAVVKTTQQRNVAETIATTLSELGFKSSNRDKLTLKQQGDSFHIQAMLDEQPSAEQRDEKIVSFDIEPDGAVAYDFSGFVGDECVGHAKRIFTALQQKGLFILDEQGIERLNRLPVEGVTTETLKAEQYELRITKNKVQASLAESLRHVMKKMGYSTIQQRTIGGSIELEAFKGQIGYRVVLSPDGDARILKDTQRKDVSGDERDPVAAEAQRTIHQMEALQEAQSEE